MEIVPVTHLRVWPASRSIILAKSTGHRRTGRGGGRGGLQPPQILGNSDFLGSKRKFGHSQLLKKFHVFFISILKR